MGFDVLCQAGLRDSQSANQLELGQVVRIDARNQVFLGGSHGLLSLYDLVVCGQSHLKPVLRLLQAAMGEFDVSFGDADAIVGRVHIEKRIADVKRHASLEIFILGPAPFECCIRFDNVGLDLPAGENGDAECGAHIVVAIHGSEIDSNRAPTGRGANRGQSLGFFGSNQFRGSTLPGCLSFQVRTVAQRSLKSRLDGQRRAR